MVNQSKANDSRFWELWKRAGAVGEVITLNTLIERLQQKGFQPHDGIPFGIQKDAGYLSKDPRSFMLPTNGSTIWPKTVTVGEQEVASEFTRKNITFALNQGDYAVYYSDGQGYYNVGYFSRLGTPLDGESKKIQRKLLG